MATVEKTALVDDVPATEKPESLPPATEDGGKTTKIKAPKVHKPRSAPTHPPFLEMITEAIVTLKEKSGSSQYAVTKYIEENQKQLPSNFRKLLLGHLRKLVASEKLVKVKNSYKLPSASAPAPSKLSKAGTAIGKTKVAAKPKTVAPAKSKAKTASKPKAKPTVAKPKTVAKSKAKPVASKPKTVAKPKAAAVKPKAATKLRSKPAAKPSKVARTSSRTRSAAKPAAPAKKPVSVKSSAKKAPAKRGRK